jgi:hypothetical protein
MRALERSIKLTTQDSPLGALKSVSLVVKGRMAMARWTVNRTKQIISEKIHDLSSVLYPEEGKESFADSAISNFETNLEANP